MKNEGRMKRDMVQSSHRKGALLASIQGLSSRGSKASFLGIEIARRRRLDDVHGPLAG